MKVLLLSMPDITPASADSMILPSLGIASLAGNVDSQAHQIKIMDLVIKRKTYWAYLKELMNDFQPQVVGLSGLTCSFHTALNVAQFIKTNYPKVVVVFGGYMATCHREQLASGEYAQWLDFIVRGEGELTFSELLNEIDGDGRFDRVAGLSYKPDGQFVHNQSRQLAPLSRINLPDRESRITRKGLHFWNMPADVVETSRGCTFDCAFCCVSYQYGRTYRAYPIDRVMSDIEKTYASGARFIVIADDNITLDTKRLNQLCDEIIQARFKRLRFFAQASVKPLAQYPELVRKMKQAGFVSLFLGLENILDRNLNFLNKKTSGYQEAVRAFSNLRKAGIISTAGLILGNPDDSETDLWANYQVLRQLKVDFPNFMTLTPFPKTRVRAEVEQMGLLTNPDDFSRYDLIQANVRTKHLSAPALQNLTKRMYRKYYFSFKYARFSLFIRKYPLFAIRYTLKELAHWLVKAIGRKLFS